MAAESGFNNQKKLGTSQFKTIQGLGSDKFGSNTAMMGLYDLVAAPIAIVSVELDEDDNNRIFLEVTAHSARQGDTLRFTDGDLVGWEVEVDEVIDPDIIAVLKVFHIDGADVLPQVGDEVVTSRWTTLKTDSSGGIVIAPTGALTPIGPKSYAEMDFAVDNVAFAAYTEVIASVGTSAIQKAQIFMSSATPLILAFGAAAAEVDKAIIIPGGNGLIDFAIPAGTRLSVRRMLAGADVVEGELLINLLG